MKTSNKKTTVYLIAITLFAIALGMFFQNCSGQMASFTPTGQVGGSSSSNSEVPSNVDGAIQCSPNQESVDGLCLPACEANQDRQNGVCVAKCDGNREQFNGVCVSKCDESQERSEIGTCIAKCDENKERINGFCVAKCDENQERINGTCAAQCSDTQERINGSCVAKCEPVEERINGTCTARCTASETRINGVCVANCGEGFERINATCVAKCPATAPRGINGQCGTITKGVPAFVNIYGIQNATACGYNELTVPLQSNANGIVTYRLEKSPFSCISPADMPIEIKYNAADGRCITGCNYVAAYTDNYFGASARILPMLSTLQSDNYSPGVIAASKNLYFVSSVPASDVIKCQVELRNYSTVHKGEIALKKATRVIAASGNGYGTTPTLYTSTDEDRSFHMYSIEWAPDHTYDSLNIQWWDKISPKLTANGGSHFLIYQNEGTLFGGSVVLGLGQVYNQYDIDRLRLFNKIIGQWFFTHRSLKPTTLSEPEMETALNVSMGYNSVVQMPYMMSITCPDKLQVYKVREPL